MRRTLIGCGFDVPERKYAFVPDESKEPDGQPTTPGLGHIQAHEMTMGNDACKPTLHPMRRTLI